MNFCTIKRKANFFKDLDDFRIVTDIVDYILLEK